MTAAQERRGGYAGTRERCDGGAGAAQLRHDPSLGCKVRAELLTEHKMQQLRTCDFRHVVVCVGECDAATAALLVATHGLA